MNTVQYAVPAALACSNHRKLGMPVVRVEAIPPEQRIPNTGAIAAKLTLVRATLLCGCVRQFGVERAWIDSDLRMHVEGGFINSRNELAQGWRVHSSEEI